MADEKISQLAAKTTIDAADLLVMVDDGTATTKNITGANHKTATLGQLENLTNAEITQLENIDTKSISNAEWGFLSLLNQNLRTTDDVVFDRLDLTGALQVTGTGQITVDRTGSGDTFVAFAESGTGIGRIAGDIGHNKIYIGQTDQATLDPWISFYRGTGNVGLNTAASSVVERFTIVSGNIQLDNTFSLQISNAAVSANAKFQMQADDVLLIDNPTSDIKVAPTGNFIVDTLTTVGGLVQTDGAGTLSSSVTLPDGTLATTQTPADNSTKLATTAYVDASTATANEFSELTDVTGAYTTARALYATNAAVDTLVETTTTLGEPAANQFTLTRGTSAVVVQNDLTIEAASFVNQDLTTDASPTWAVATLSTLTTAGGIVQTSGAGLLSSSITLPAGTLATTQTPGDSTTKLATTQYVDAAVTLEDIWDRVLGTPNYVIPDTAADDIGATGARITKMWGTDIDTTNMPTVGGTSINANAVLDLTTAEVTQLATIGTSTVSAGQWGNVGAMDQDVATTSSPTFAALSLTAALTEANGGTGETTFTDGQLLIGNTGSTGLDKATLTGTANQITVTGGAGTITLSTPQDLAVTSTPTFDDIKQTVHTDDVSNPPTDAELDAIFGTPAAVGAGFTAYINDAGLGSNFYQIVSDGTNWWIFTGTVAA